MDIIKIFIDSNFNLEIFISKYLLVIFVIVSAIWLFRFYKKHRSRLNPSSFEIDEAIIGIGNSTVKFKPNYKDTQIAYSLWIELSTRKIGLPIDLENDVIAEVLNSWYTFFKITRDLLKQVPVSRLQDSKGTKTIVNIAIEVLNKGMRPFLTKWQAKFRKWYDEEKGKTDNQGMSPQEIQSKFQQYTLLTEEMIEVNQRMIHYRKILKTIVFNDQT